MGVAWLAILLVVVGVSGCTLLDPACPRTPADADAEEFEARSADTNVFTGYVIRYVDSPDLDARGYDLNVRRWLLGRPSPEGTFLRVTEPLPGIGPGDPVLIVAEPGPREPLLVAGRCPPLTLISEAEVEG
jgi:hypothetical protein